MNRCLGIELRHVATLAVNEERSFRVAADRLGYVESAVSQQVARPELMPSVRLVERARGQGRVELTEDGKLDSRMW